MTGSDDEVLAAQLEQVTQRLAAVEAEQFGLVAQVRQASASADRVANGLDDLEDVLHEVSYTTADQADQLAAALAQRQAALATPAPPDPADQAAAAPESARPELDELHTWVQTYIAPLVRKISTTGEGGGIRWCRQWWHHYDAVERFYALRGAFTELEAMAADSPSWLSVYLRDHLDPHLAVLTSPGGPFYGCTPIRHTDTATALGVDDGVVEPTATAS
jgi:hypothetical protein